MGRKTRINILIVMTLLVCTFFLGQLSASDFFKENQDEINATSITYANTDNSISIEEAKDIAEAYLKAGPYSKRGLARTLSEYEYVDEQVAKDAVKELDIDWQEQANKELEDYLDMDGKSESQIRSYMSRDLFSDEQIDKAFSSIDIDWQEQAVTCAQVLHNSGASKITIQEEMLSRGFSDEDVQKALDLI